MGQYSDARGVPVSAGDRKLLDQLDEAATLFHGYFADPVAAVDRALERDPGFIMGLALKGGIYATSSEKAAEPVPVAQRHGGSHAQRDVLQETRHGSRVAQRSAECSKGAGIPAARLQAEEPAQSRAGQALRACAGERLVSGT